MPTALNLSPAAGTAVIGFTWTPWGLPILAVVGAAVSVLVVWLVARALREGAWVAVVQMLGPLRSIGRALLPLALPVLVICAFATRAVSPFLQFVAGVVLAALVWLFLRGEGELAHERSQVRELGARTRGVRAGRVWQSVVRTLVPTLAIGLAGALVILWIGGFFGQFSSWSSDAGASGWIEFFALVFVAIALPYRLIGYATNWYRIVAAAALAALMAQVFVAAGALRGAHILRTLHLDLGWASVGFLVLFFGVLFAEAVRVAYPPHAPNPFQRIQRAAGLLTTFGSALLLFVALLIASLDTTGGADRLRGSAAAPLAPPIVDAGGSPDRNLAWTFAPLLHIRHDERWGPSRVGVFLAHALESGAGHRPGSAGKVTEATLPDACPDGTHDPCGTLRCDSCADMVTRWPDPSGAKTNFLPKGVFYVRVARVATDPTAFRGWNPWGSELKTLVQYWLFYLYDRWETETVVGRLTQEHQGDWEFVAVGLGSGDRPLFVAMSAHCGGQVVPWTKTLPTAFGYVRNGKVVMTDRQGPNAEASHPIVAVARGSHANYSDDGGHRPPDWGSCKALPSAALTAISYASNVRDLTEDGKGGWFVYPSDVDVVETTNGLPRRPFSYPGSWGADETVTFSHHAPIDTGEGPRSPPLQGKSWQTPIALFFCDPYWHGADGMHGTQAECHPKRQF